MKAERHSEIKDRDAWDTHKNSSKTHSKSRRGKWDKFIKLFRLSKKNFILVVDEVNEKSVSISFLYGKPLPIKFLILSSKSTTVLISFEAVKNCSMDSTISKNMIYFFI